MASADAIADSYWADVFEVVDAELWPDGVHPTFVDSGWDGIYLMRVGRSVRLRVPMRLRGTVEELVGLVSVDAVMSRSLWSLGLAELCPTVLGPASHFLADSLLDERGHAVELDRDEVSSFAAELSSAEVEEAGISEEGAALFGVFVDGELAAVASLGEWAGELSDVGVITAPHFRKQGLGRIVATAAINKAVSRGGFARWRSREDNLGSIHLAQRLGLTHYGTNLGVRLG
jgi:ribosomal protein S18 acetylase RimI-like enzyme